MTSSSEITRTLIRYSHGDPAALDMLLPAVYDELRKKWPALPPGPIRLQYSTDGETFVDIPSGPLDAAGDNGTACTPSHGPGAADEHAIGCWRWQNGAPTSESSASTTTKAAEKRRNRTRSPSKAKPKHAAQAGTAVSMNEP